MTCFTILGLGRPLNRPVRRRFLGFLGGLLLSVSLWPLLLGHSAQAQTIATATVTEILDSNQVYIQSQPAQVNSVAQRQQRVRTQTARASLRFNTGAIARLAHNSSLVVSQCAQLNRGTLLVNGPLNGCSTTTVAGVRGTIYTLAVTETGQTVIQVFEGEVVVAPQTEPLELVDDLEPLSNPEGSVESDPKVLPAEPKQIGGKQSDPAPEPTAAPGPSPSLDPVAPSTATEPAAETLDFTPESSIVVAEGQQITVDAEKQEAVIAALTAEDFIDLLEGPLIQGFIELPGLRNLRDAFQRLFPNIPLPYGLPAVPVPLPSIRFPF